MNNNPIANIPNAPADVDWPIFMAIKNINFDFGATDELKINHRVARRTLMVQLKLMAETRCNACGGRSHVSRDCPTNKRLTLLGQSCAEWSYFIAYARKKVI